MRFNRPISNWGEQRWCALEAHIMAMSVEELYDATMHYSAWGSRAPAVEQLRNHVLVAIYNAAKQRETKNG